MPVEEFPSGALSRNIRTMSEPVNAVFLDRDGVINEKLPEGKYISDCDKLSLLPGAARAIAELNAAGIKAIVVTNQRGIALGHLTAQTLSTIHMRLEHQLNEHDAHVDAIYHCPHDDDNSCECRKPKPGLFLQAFGQFPDVAPATCVLVGDSLSDIMAARNLGMRSILVTGNEQTRKAGFEDAARLADIVCDNLCHAVQEIFSRWL